MQSLEVIPLLNQLLQILCRSLPLYLADARPWARPEDQPLQTALQHLAADQQRYARRLAEAITELGGRPDFGHFPTEFTAKHDLSLDFLLQEVIKAQEQDMATIADCAAQLNNAPLLHSLAEEILGNARGHLEILQELSANRTCSVL